VQINYKFIKILIIIIQKLNHIYKIIKINNELLNLK